MIAQFRDPARARTPGHVRAARPLRHARRSRRMCVYLLSDQAAFVTGAEFVLDGGLTAQ